MYFPILKLPISKTISISSAPSSFAFFVAKTRTSVEEAPQGQSTAGATFISVPLSSSLANFTHLGFIQTARKPYFFAS